MNYLSSWTSMIFKCDTKIKMLRIATRKPGTLLHPYDENILQYFDRKVIHPAELVNFYYTAIELAVYL